MSNNLPFVSPDTFKKGMELLVVLDAVLNVLKDSEQFAAVKDELKQDLTNAIAAREEAEKLSQETYEKTQVLEKMEADLKDLGNSLILRESAVAAKEQELADTEAALTKQVEDHTADVAGFKTEVQEREEDLTKREVSVKVREDKVSAELKQVAAKEKELDEKLSNIAEFGKSVAKKG